MATTSSASKTQAKTPEKLWEELDITLSKLKTDYLDIYQLHQVPQCYRPGDGTGMYEALLEAKEKGLVRHIGLTAHKIGVAEEAIASGLYETLQYPFNYLATDREIAMVKACGEAGMGFIAMKGLSGGLLNNSRACMAFMSQFDNVVPIWGVQHESELDEWLSFFNEEVEMDETSSAIIEKDRRELSGEFCRSCGYCMPCTMGIMIRNCARMIQMIRRSPSAKFLTPEWQAEMEKIDSCIECGVCMTRCPYELHIPELLRKNLEDYRRIVSGEIKI